jgi:hypothetical protein
MYERAIATLRAVAGLVWQPRGGEFDADAVLWG